MQREASQSRRTHVHARTSLKDQTPAAAGDLGQVTRHHLRASKLFEKEHAYAARLVQITTAIRNVVRSTITMKLQGEEPSDILQNDEIAAGAVAQPREHGSGP